MADKETRRCLSKARERVFEIFAEAEEDITEEGHVDLTLIELSIIEAMYEAFGEDFHDSE